MTIKVLLSDKKAAKYRGLILKNAQKLARFLRLDGYVEIYLVGNRQMKKNVLTYLALRGFPRPDLKQKPLGEIYLNPFFIKKSKEDLLFMLTHGFLHIAGYDHIKKNDRIMMEKKELQLFRKLKS
ncbi:MAG: rRNA maturation RNAse YbeY [Candidatus Pacebacteria bacterium]|nr:rRNA maturation RNAse YbeY [Candidatus Paceibacterota bacterium]